MSDEDEVLDAARRRAAALGRGDRDALEELLHPRFLWTSHRGDTFDRAGYLDSNTSGRLTWHGQELTDVVVRAVGEVAVLRCTVVDDVTVASGRETFRMPLTTTWVREGGSWRCLAGHAGPRLES